MIVLHLKIKKYGIINKIYRIIVIISLLYSFTDNGRHKKWIERERERENKIQILGD